MMNNRLQSPAKDDLQTITSSSSFWIPFQMLRHPVSRHQFANLNKLVLLFAITCLIRMHAFTGKVSAEYGQQV
ncbi:hypothetical protein Ocin01_09985 [Orchesella cincta]|uniref:Uncharacterized protein n=1 Tax=Orchesella cincta TaxID=48709 RepID=A0A1D2MUW2_ORCCI|nr:hypothetical protein Ocin01_09985 [Orchesella cincta]